MKLGRLNHIGVATPSIADSIVFYRDVMGATKTWDQAALDGFLASLNLLSSIMLRA